MFGDTPDHPYLGSGLQTFVLFDLISKAFWACPSAYLFINTYTLLYWYIMYIKNHNKHRHLQRTFLSTQ